MISIKAQRINNALKEIKNRRSEGAILEFGVYLGESLYEVVDFVRKNLMPNKIYGFDSFIGLPEADSVQCVNNGHKFTWTWRKGEYASSYNRTRQELIRKLGNINDVALIPGIYEKILDDDLLKALEIESVDLIHIDCDLIKSCETVLTFCKPLMRQGTFIVFDEWTLGEDKCWEIFEKKNKLKVEHDASIDDHAVGNHIVKIVAA